jgi:hypothetical protein
MSALMTILTAAAVATGLVAAPVAAGPYREDRYVDALRIGRLDDLLAGTERTPRSEMASYLAGFTLWYDGSCDFLPMATFETIRKQVAKARRSGMLPARASAVDAGYQDAKSFLRERGCASREAGIVQAELTRFWTQARPAADLPDDAGAAPSSRSE